MQFKQKIVDTVSLNRPGRCSYLLTINKPVNGISQIILNDGGYAEHKLKALEGRDLIFQVLVLSKGTK